MKNLRIGILNELYGSRITEKQREVVRAYYDFDLSLAEIAVNFGITRQAVLDALKKGEGSLLELEDELGFYAKTMSVKSGLESLRRRAEERDPESVEIIDAIINRL